MIKVKLTNTGKRFNREWIFRHINYEFVAGKQYAITGANGSGKSTLLQVIAGSLNYNEGSVEFSINDLQCPAEDHYTYTSFAAPYLELIEEMTTLEFLTFHRAFKPLTLSNEALLKIVQLQNAANKEIRYFSSGMKQRLKLAQAFFSANPLLLLDEPTTNLDAEGIALYHQLIREYGAQKLVIISSNDKQEYDFCEKVIEMANYK